MKFGSILYRSSTYSALASGLNLLFTICVVRWFGTAAYADYIVDLAALSLVTIALEAVPGNYSLFRVQEDPGWAQTLAAQTVAGSLGVAALVALGGAGGIFQAWSGWLCVYAATLAVKKYMDIRLQSSGRLDDFMRIEAKAAAFRLVLLGAALLASVQATTAIWGSFAVATLLAQALWFRSNRAELHDLRGAGRWAAWQMLGRNFRAYPPYYLGIALKRVKDNFVPIAADRLFASPDLLAAFFLAYRGTLFGLGQLRLVEAMLNYRRLLETAVALGWRKRALIALGGQLLCIGASVVLLVLSGTPQQPWLTAVVLSALVWPVGFFMLERARAYSAFEAGRVNVGMAAYIVVFLTGALVMKASGVSNITAFAALAVLAEVATFGAAWGWGRR